MKIKRDNLGIHIGTGGVNDKIGFHAVTPVVQRSGSAQAAVTTTVGAALGAFTDPPDAAEMAALRTQANALRVDVLALTTLANELRAATVAKGLIKGSA